MAAMSSVTASLATTLKFALQLDLTGGEYSPITSNGTIQKTYDFGTANGNTTSGGGDIVFSFQQAIAAGSSATVDLIAMTDLFLRTSQTIARIKAMQIRLLSAADDSTLSPAPNASSTIIVTNAIATLPSPLDILLGGTGLTVTITNTAGAITGIAIGAAGTGYPKSTTILVAPVQTSGSGGLLAVTVNSSGVPTAVAIDQAGAGYSDATVPSVAVGYHYILTGGARVYFDPSATGFCLVSSTQKNITIQNQDGSNAVTAELSFFAATT